MRIITLLAALFLASTVFAAADSAKIVAVVNDQIISSVDMEERIVLILATTGIPDTDANRARILPQVLHQLVDEKLQLQDAAKEGITINDVKIQQAIAQIERQNGKPAGSLLQFLHSKGVSDGSFSEQIRAQVAWSEIVGKKIRPRIRVSDQEIARYTRRRQSSPSAIGEVLIATIQLPVDSPQKEQAVAKFADKLASDIRGGASFEAVASQFSAGSGSTKASDPFWVELSALDPAIAKVLGKVAKGSVSDPVKTESGYQIIKLFDTREKAAGTEAAAVAKPNAELAFRQVIITPKSGVAADKLQALASEISNSPPQCDGKPAAVSSATQEATISVLFTRNMENDLPEPVRQLLDKTAVGTNSVPLATAEGVRIFTLCERIDIPPANAKSEGKVPADTARQALFTEKLELEAQKYMRNLRSEAFIEVRGF